MPDSKNTTKPKYIPPGRFRGAFLFAMKRHLHAAGYRRCATCQLWRSDISKGHYYCTDCLPAIIARTTFTTVKKRCAICHKECNVKIGNASKWKYCSRPCNRRGQKGAPRSGKWTLKPKLCQKCGNTFSPKGATTKICDECIKCPICGRMPKRRTAYRCCSPACGNEWRRQNHIPSPRRGKAQPRKQRTSRSSEREVAMGRLEYRVWRATVFKRDDYACVICSSAKSIQAHHIFPWCDHLERRYDPDNGVTLCKIHHTGLARREHLFADRFVALVIRRLPLELTPEELDNLQPKTITCRFCKKVIPSERNRLQHSFCNWDCKRDWLALQPKYVSKSARRSRSDKQLLLF